MKGIELVHRSKALLLSLFFFGMAFILVWQRGQGVASFLDQYTLGLATWVGLFILGGLTNLWVAVRNADWQILGFVGWYTYTVATFFAIAEGRVPIIAGWIYAVMCLLFVIETWNAFKGVFRWIRSL